MLAMSRDFAKYLCTAHLINTTGLWGETAFVILFIDEHRLGQFLQGYTSGLQKNCGSSLSSQYPLSHFFTPSCSAARVHEGSSHVVKLRNQFLCKDWWHMDPAVIHFDAVIRLGFLLCYYSSCSACRERRYTLDFSSFLAELASFGSLIYLCQE